MRSVFLALCQIPGESGGSAPVPLSGAAALIIKIGNAKKKKKEHKDGNKKTTNCCE